MNEPTLPRLQMLCSRIACAAKIFFIAISVYETNITEAFYFVFCFIHITPIQVPQSLGILILFAPMASDERIELNRIRW